MSELSYEIKNALSYIKHQTGASAIFLYLPNGIAYVIEESGKQIFGLADKNYLPDLIVKAKNRHVEIVAQIGIDGQYEIPNPFQIEIDKEIDY